MYRNLLLSLVLTAFLASGALAQSSSKGGHSGSRSKSSRNNVAAEMKKQKRMAAKEQAKLVGQIQREDFAGIKLSTDQRNKLKSLVAANYERLAKFDMEMGSMIPAAKQKNLQKSYLMAKKEGMSHAESMKKSMMTVGIKEMTTEKVMKINVSRQEVMDQIIAGVTEMFTDEQNKKKMEMMAGESSDEEEGEKIGE